MADPDDEKTVALKEAIKKSKAKALSISPRNPGTATEANSAAEAKSEASRLQSEPMPPVPVTAPQLMPATSEDAGILTPRRGQELANRAGREVVAFDVLLCHGTRWWMMSEARQIILEVGDHGLSCRDRNGEMLKVVPLEYVIGWKVKEEFLELLISKDLETFYRMRFKTSEGASIEESFNRVATERVERGTAEGSPPRRSISASIFGETSFFGRARGASVLRGSFGGSGRLSQSQQASAASPPSAPAQTPVVVLREI